jgi:predicted PurR-regulated permease PerM
MPTLSGVPAPIQEAVVEFLRAQRERRNTLTINDPKPVENVDDIWSATAEISTIGIFILLLGACFYLCRPLLLPILSAVVIGMTFAPLIKFGARHGVSPWLTAVVLVVLVMIVVGLVATAIAAPLTEWIARAPEIGANIRQKLYVLDRPLSALRELQETLLPSAGSTIAVEPSHISMVTPVVAFVTPAVAQVLLFLVTLLFFLAGQMEFRRYVASFIGGRDAKLRFIRITNDIEHNLASYVATVTAINVCLGIVVTVGTWLFGFPSPVIFGILAMVLNYIPYIGPGCMAIILFAVGLVTFPSLGYALLPPAAFVALTTIEGHILTPAVLGRRLTLNPLAVLLALAFWTWMWGPMGAFLAVPLTLMGLVTINHLFPDEDVKLPN